MSYRGGRNRRDVKSRTMNTYTAFDADVGSQYDYEEDDSPANTVRRDQYQGTSRGGGGFDRKNQGRRDNQLVRIHGTGTAQRGQREFVALVTVRNCARSGKEYILKQISEAVDNFRPIAPKINQGHVEFYTTVEDAEAVKSMSRRIVDRKTGAKLTIITSRLPAPWDPLKPTTKTLIENVVKSRYGSGSNSLDLGDFANDKAFLNAGVHCPLFNNAIVVHVCNVIARLYSTIQGISLKGNRLRQLDFISTMVYAAPVVTELDLSSNAITRIDELDRIRGWRVEKLHLENNECVSRFTADAYASAIHDYFPRVNYLDGIFITQNPFKINAEENDGFILPYKLGFHPDANAREHVERFILEYLSLYDGPNGEQTRKNLMNAYDDSATMTFAVYRLKDSYAKNFGYIPKGDEEAYSNYIRSSHNILMESKWSNYRDKIIYKGAMDIAVALSKLPLTTHLKETFILDFNFFSSELITFTLQGVLRDGSDAFKDNGDCKFFVRNFVVVPRGENKMAIVSDMLSLTPISTERMERYINLLKKGAANDLQAQQQPGTSAVLAQLQQQSSLSVPSISAAISNTSEMFGMLGVPGHVPAPPSTPQPPAQSMDNTSTSGVAPPKYDVNDPTIRQAMIKQFSEISKMRPEWSEKCLLDCNWNFEAAGNAFNTMHSQNQIPPEAFQ